MLSTENFDALIVSLRQSLKHCQNENLGRPFDKAAQYAFAADSYSTSTAFDAEFEAWLYNAADQERLRAYIHEVYHPIAYYGTLFACLERDYERRLAGDGRSKLSPESYLLAGAYQSAIADMADRMLNNAAKYAKVDLVSFRELTLNSFTIDGKYILAPLPTDEETQVDLTEREQILVHCYQQKPPIVRGQPGYPDYLRFARPGDRTAYPNDSVRKAKSLIRSIERILPFLTEPESQQAQKEVITIKANFHNQL